VIVEDADQVLLDEVNVVCREKYGRRYGASSTRSTMRSGARRRRGSLRQEAG
jgi:hypothetical protein